MKYPAIKLAEDRRIFKEKVAEHCGKNAKEDLKISEETYVHGLKDSIS